jgi:hypothetical protein
MAKKKQEIITFKVDESMSRAMHRIPNRSEFIRGAVLAALDNVCPLCQGTGILTPDQKTHWETFSSDHPVNQCDDCQAIYIECSATKGKRRPRGPAWRGKR